MKAVSSQNGGPGTAPGEQSPLLPEVIAFIRPIRIERLLEIGPNVDAETKKLVEQRGRDSS